MWRRVDELKFTSARVMLSCPEISEVSLNFREEFLQKLTPTNEVTPIYLYRYHHSAGDVINTSKAVQHWLSESNCTGEFFPGRTAVRPRIDSGKTSRAENIARSRKSYRASQLHSPGIFTEECCCTYTNILGLSVKSGYEGVNTAIFVLVSRFKHLPRVCYYDNPCKMLRSIALRLPWIKDTCVIVCDRFHPMRHTCNSIYDPDSYLSCSNHLTSVAESLINQWNFSKPHVRYLSEDNMMAFLSVRAVFINLRNIVRKSRK